MAGYRWVWCDAPQSDFCGTPQKYVRLGCAADSAELRLYSKDFGRDSSRTWRQIATRVEVHIRRPVALPGGRSDLGLWPSSTTR